jgi:maltooligosyltrehalose trehalohydrolase
VPEGRSLAEIEGVEEEELEERLENEDLGAGHPPPNRYRWTGLLGQLRWGNMPGMRFRVWAPYATEVELVLDGARRAMDAGGSGWFEAAVAEASPGMDYGYAIDGGEVLPDPRSRWQPSGVTGLSRIPESFRAWTDGGWTPPPIEDWVLYELHIGTFTPGGTFDDAIARLPHLVELGVTTVELMPVAEFSGDHGWGYDGVDLFSPHHAYGGPDGLKRFVDAAHGNGLAVVLDVVYNHLGPAGNHLGRFGPYFTDHYSTPWGDAVNFDGAGSDEVRRFFIDNALLWLADYHFDGLRLDAVHAILDLSAKHFLEQLAEEVGDLVERLGRPLYLIAESDLGDPRVVTAPDFGGFGIDAQWNDDFHHSLHALLTGERSGYYVDFGAMGDLAKSARQAFVYDGRYSQYRGRTHGRPVPGISAAHFLAYLQNHDQVGNRATGDRSSSLMSTELLKVGAALVLLSPFVPLLFQGEEWGARTPFRYFTGHLDPELGRAVSEGRKREFSAFGWDPDEVPDPQDPATFMASKLDWDEMNREPHTGLLDWHRRLLEVRRATGGLGKGRIGDVETTFDDDQKWIVLRRARMTIAANLSEVPVEVPLADDPGRPLLSSPAEPQRSGDSLKLEPESVAVYYASGGAE